jgi:predicted transcriptional regulator
MKHDNNGMESENMEYPDTLRVEIGTTEEMFEDAIATAEAYEQGTAGTGGDAEAVVTFESVDQLRKVLTDRRIELIEDLMAAPAESISQLAERVGRTYSVVHDDVDILVAAGIVKRREDGAATGLFVPYESVEIGITLRAAGGGDGEETVA